MIKYIFSAISYIENSFQKKMLNVMIWNLNAETFENNKKKRVLLSFCKDGFNEMIKTFKEHQTKDEPKRWWF